MKKNCDCGVKLEEWARLKVRLDQEHADLAKSWWGFGWRDRIGYLLRKGASCPYENHRP